MAVLEHNEHYTDKPDWETIYESPDLWTGKAVTDLNCFN